MNGDPKKPRLGLKLENSPPEPHPFCVEFRAQPALIALRELLNPSCPAGQLWEAEFWRMWMSCNCRAAAEAVACAAEQDFTLYEFRVRAIPVPRPCHCE